jgi:hypothetical protein
MISITIKSIMRMHYNKISPIFKSILMKKESMQFHSMIRNGSLILIKKEMLNQEDLLRILLLVSLFHKSMKRLTFHAKISRSPKKISIPSLIKVKQP